MDNNQLLAMVMQLLQQQAQPAAEHAAPELCVIDIETRNPDNVEELIAEKLANWEPPANIKDPEKIEARRSEAADKLKPALWDSAPICSIAVKTGTETVVFIHGSGVEAKGFRVVECGSEREVLERFGAWADATLDNAVTTIGGHNILKFDLPKLRRAFVCARFADIRAGKSPAQILSMPRFLTTDKETRPKIFDTMDRARYFLTENSLFVSVEKLAAAFGLESHKRLISGAEIPKLWEQGEFTLLATYNAGDVDVEWKLAQAMMPPRY